MNNEKIYSVVAIILAIGLVAVTLLALPNQGQQNQLQVNGVATLKETPDQATIFLNIETRKETALLSQEEASKILNRVINSLEREGISLDKIQTESFSIYPEYHYPREGEPILLGYRTVYSLRVVTTDIEKVGNLIDATIRAGANRVRNIEFGLSESKIEEAKIRVIGEAVNNAQIKAKAMAEAGNFRLGKISYISESSYNIIPYTRTLEVAMKDSAVLPPADVELSASVSIIYKI